MGLLPQPHCPWVSIVVLFSSLHVGHPLGFATGGCPGGLGFAPERARCGSGAAAWVAGVLAASGTQGSWRLGQQCSRMVWQPVLANTLQYSCLENPHSDREAWQATVYRVAKSRTLPKQSRVHRSKAFLACGSSAPVRARCRGVVAAWVTVILAAPGTQGS